MWLVVNVPSVGFNPHSHTGSDLCQDQRAIFTEVSIHTPTRGVTKGRVKARHTKGFNPHSHTGSDLHVTAIALGTHVSIHTPTRGVTVRALVNATSLGFNPHSHTGSDLIMAIFFGKGRVFQSTLPHGE